jgi:DNA-binding HxlR family transcriptional regulator
VRRFKQLQLGLGIAPNTLSRRLRALCDAGLLERRRYHERPVRNEYVLTEEGLKFGPALRELLRWGRGRADNSARPTQGARVGGSD